MSDRIRVLIVDDIPETREHLAKLLGFEGDIEVVATAASGPEAIEIASHTPPDIVLMDINMPGMDGIAATEQIAARAPTAAVIMMSVQGEADYLRRSMLAGAREFLVKPFSSDELVTSIRKVHEREREKAGRFVEMPAHPNGREPEQEPGRVVALFSPKGGVGRTTIAVNLAVAAQQLDHRVALVDASLQFGDVAVMLNVDPRSRSMADLVPEMAAGDPDSLESALVAHSSGVHLLLAPPSPETAELIPAAYVRRAVERLRGTHDLVVVDCASWLNDTTLGILDVADLILVVLTLEITGIKNIRLFLEVVEQLGYPADRVRLVLNRADSTLGIRVADVEQSLGRKVEHTIVSDGRSVVYALNRGVPFVLSNRDTQVSQDILALARAVAGQAATAATAASTKATPARRSLFARR